MKKHGWNLRCANATDAATDLYDYNHNSSDRRKWHSVRGIVYSQLKKYSSIERAIISHWDTATQTRPWEPKPTLIKHEQRYL